MIHPVPILQGRVGFSESASKEPRSFGFLLCHRINTFTKHIGAHARGKLPYLGIVCGERLHKRPDPAQQEHPHHKVESGSEQYPQHAYQVRRDGGTRVRQPHHRSSQHEGENTLGHSAHNGESEYTEDSVRQARIVFIVEETHQNVAVRALGDSQIEGGNVDQKRREVSGDGGPKMQPPLGKIPHQNGGEDHAN